MSIVFLDRVWTEETLGVTLNVLRVKVVFIVTFNPDEIKFNNEGFELYVRIKKVDEGLNEGGFRISLIVSVTKRVDIEAEGKQLEILTICDDIKFGKHEVLLNDADIKLNEPLIGTTVGGNSI